jgi:hypothetical protein
MNSETNFDHALLIRAEMFRLAHLQVCDTAQQVFHHRPKLLGLLELRGGFLRALQTPKGMAEFRHLVGNQVS